MEQQVIEFLLGLAQNQPWLLSAVLVHSVCRAVFKPVCSVWESYVNATPGTKDDEYYAEFKKGKIYSALDYLFSIKIPEKQK